MELNDSTLLKLEKYLMEDMSQEEIAVFEDELKSSSELREFITIFRSIDQFNDEQSWVSNEHSDSKFQETLSRFRDPKTLEFKEKLKSFREQKPTAKIDSSKSSRKTFLWLAVAASVAIIFFLSFPKGSSLDEVYASHSSWEEVPSFTVKGDIENNQLLEVEKAFKAKDYAKSVSLAKSIVEGQNTDNANLLIYMGLSQLELDQFDNSISTFSKLLSSHSIDNHKAHWYLALVQMKKGDQASTIAALEKVLQDSSNYKYKEAEAILKELK